MHKIYCKLCGITHMSITKRQQQEFPTGKVILSVIGATVVVLVIIGIISWSYGTDQKWYDTGIVISSQKTLADVNDQYSCCSWVQNITILTDHHGQISIITGQNGNLQNDQSFNLHVKDLVAIRQNNNGKYQVFPDP